MNYKIAKTGLVLCVVYLVAFYIIKFIFPQILIQTISSPTLIRLGEVMKTYPFVEYVFRLISNFVVLYLFACSGSGKFKFKLWQFIVILICDIINNIVIVFLPELYTHTSIVTMLVCALVCKGNLLYVTISFSIHGYLSQFLLSIRGFETIMIYFNAISGFLIALEIDVWLLLLAIIFNIKENKKYGNMGTALCE